MTNEDTSLAREFVAPSDVDLKCVSFYVRENRGGAFTAKVRILVGGIALPYDPCGEYVQWDAVIPAGVVDFPVTVPLDFERPDGTRTSGFPLRAGTRFVVELNAPSRNPATGGDGGLLSFGCNPFGETEPTYIRAPACGASEFVTLDSVGFGGRALAMSVGYQVPPPTYGTILCVGGAPLANASVQLTYLENGSPVTTTTVTTDSQGAFSANFFPAYSSLLNPQIEVTSPSCPSHVWTINALGNYGDLGLLICPTCAKPPFPHACCPVPTQTIVLRSGQVNGAPGTHGSLDSTIKRYAAPGCNNSVVIGGLVPHGAACAGSPAVVITPYFDYLPAIPADPQARWISSAVSTFDPPHGDDRSALYCHPFTINPGAVQQACLTISFAVDDTLGDPAGPGAFGVYINGIGLPISGGNRTTATTVTVSIPPSSLMPGLNNLQIYQRDLGCSISGVIYSAQIDICSVPFPTPCSNCLKPKENIVLRSGQSGGVPAAPGTLDSVMTFSPVGANSCCGFPLSGFPLACGTSAPMAITPHSAWTSSLPVDPFARWINYTGTPASFFKGTPPRSVQYCHPFKIQSSGVVSACLRFSWLADDRLGDAPNGPSVYINSCMVPGISGGNFSTASTQTVIIPVTCLNTNGGSNVLKVYQRDTGCVVSGVNYVAQLSVCGVYCADYNRSGEVTVQDIFDFLGGYFGNERAADANEDGAVSVQDIFDYLRLYFTSGPNSPC